MEINALNESSAQFCMTCLDTRSKLYLSSSYNLDFEYENLTGISLGDVVNFTPMFCSECAQRLVNSGRLRDKSLRAFQLLAELHHNNAVLSLKTLSSVDRARCQLTSSIVQKAFDPNHCDLYVMEETGSADQVDMKNSKIDLHEKLHIKHETKLESGAFSDDAAEFNADDFNTDVEMDDAEDGVDLLYIDHFSNDDLSNHGDNTQGEQRNTNVKTRKKLPVILNRNTKIDIKNSDDEWPNDMDDYVYIDIDTNEDIQNSRYTTTRGKVNKGETVDDKTESVSKRRAVKRKHSSSDEEKPLKKVVRVKRGTPKISLRPKIKREPKCVPIKWIKKNVRSPEEQVADWTQRQDYKGYKEAPYKCTDCYKPFLNEKTYNLHMEKHTDKYGAFECHICRVRKRSRKFLSKHLRTTHKFLHRCTECDFVTSNRKTAMDHSRWHDGKTYECERCGKVFGKPTSYYNHVRLAHPSDFVCALCGYSFANQRGVWLHQRIAHRDHEQELSGPQCEQCDVRFASEAAYETHLQVSPKHGAPGALKRNDASSGVSGSWNFGRKQRQERRRFVTKCELCSDVLESRLKHYWHMRQCHPDSLPNRPLERDFMCEQCGKLCSSKFILMEHVLRHGSPTLECDACDKKFYSDNALKTHVERAHEYAPKHTYVCAHCAYQTKERGNLKRHMQVHMEEDAREWFHCTVCETKTTTSYALKSHMLHVHQKVPWPTRAPRVRAAVPRARAAVPQSRTAVTQSRAAVPRARAAVPQSRASVPQARAAVPQSRAAVPQSRAAVPRARAAVPQSRAAVPQARAAVPQSRAAVPQSRAAVPQVRAAVPQSRAAVTNSRAAVTQSRAAVPQVRTVVPRARAAIPQSRAATPQSCAAVPQSRAAVPQVRTVVPRARAAILRSRAADPQVRAAVPQVRTVVPQSRAAVPQLRTVLVRARGAVSRARATDSSEL